MREGTAEILGAVTAGVLDGVLEGMVVGNPSLFGKFPYLDVPGLPNTDDLLVLGVSGLVFLLGRASKNPAAKAFGKGMLYYSGPMAVKETTTKWVAVAAKPA